MSAARRSGSAEGRCRPMAAAPSATEAGAAVEPSAAALLARDKRVERLGVKVGEAEPEPEVPPLTCQEEPGRGWCYRASRELPAQTVLICSAPDISALYTDHTADFCASCFQRAPEQGKPLTLCQGCERFALCASCDEGGELRRWHESDECAAFKRIPAVRLPNSQGHPGTRDRLQRGTSLRATMTTICSSIRLGPHACFPHNQLAC